MNLLSVFFISISTVLLSTGANTKLKFTKPVTGSSSAYLEITPIGYADDGIILCRTVFTQNEMGAAALMEHEYGYLLVSANGMWEEVHYSTIHNYMGYDSLESLEKIFYKRMDFSNPPKFLDSIIREHHIERHADEIGKNEYFWTTKAIYDGYDKPVNASIRQKSIKGFTNKTGKGTRIPCSYAIKGVLFFENSTSYNEDYTDYIQIGATFFQTDFTFPISLYTATGICFIKK
jgi:hypothetical protein